jgi:hypothetical protein
LLFKSGNEMRYANELFMRNIKKIKLHIMKRELILCLKDGNYDRKKAEMEIEMMKKFLPYIESYNTFEASNDIFDMHDHKLLTRSHKIIIALEEGLVCTTKYYVFCRN